MELKYKTALVTGAGAIGGIGHATAMLLAREGAQIVIAGRDANRGEAVIKELTDTGASARLITSDLLTPTTSTRSRGPLVTSTSSSITRHCSRSARPSTRISHHSTTRLLPAFAPRTSSHRS